MNNWSYFCKYSFVQGESLFLWIIQRLRLKKGYSNIDMSLSHFFSNILKIKHLPNLQHFFPRFGDIFSTFRPWTFHSRPEKLFLTKKIQLHFTFTEKNSTCFSSLTSAELLWKHWKNSIFNNKTNLFTIKKATPMKKVIS